MTKIEENTTFYKKHKDRIFTALKFIIAAGIIYYLYLNLNPELLLESAANADLLLLIIAAAGIVPNIYLQYVKWKETAEHILEEKNRGKLFLSLFYGFSGALFTPARIGEYFGRAITFKDKSLLQVTAATLIDKFFTLIFTYTLGLTSVLLFIYKYYKVNLYLVSGMMILLVVITSLIVLLLFNESFWDNYFFNKIRNSKFLYKYLSKLRILKTLDKKFTIKMLAVSCIFYVTFIAQFAVLLKAFFPAGSILVLFWAANLIIFTKTVIPAVTLGEFGIREGAAVFFMKIIYSAEMEGLNASLILYFINVVFPALVGMFLLVKKNDN